MPAANAAPSPCYNHLQRVYWEDTDAGGVVFYANYLKFFERARTEWLRHLGIGQQALRETTGAIFVVTDTQVSYRAPARLDDQLRVTVAVQHCATASMRIDQQAWCGSVLVAEGRIRIACVDAHRFKPRRVPLAVTDQVQQWLHPVHQPPTESAPQPDCASASQPPVSHPFTASKSAP